MLHGLMVVNAFLRTTKFDDIYHTLLSAAHGEGMELDVRTNAESGCAQKRNHKLNNCFCCEPQIKIMLGKLLMQVDVLL